MIHLFSILRVSAAVLHGVLTHTANRLADDTDAAVTLSRDTLNKIILQETKLADAISSGDVKISGDQEKVTP